MLLLVVLFAATLGLSFLCSILEAVILSVTPSYVTALEKRRPRMGALLASFKRDAERPLAAILSLNTIANTAGATGVGAQALVVFGRPWVGIVSALLTLLVLFVSEIIPKTIGASHWRALAPFATRATNGLIYALYPFVLAGGLVRRLVQGKRRPQARVSEAEVHAMVELGSAEGVLRDSESRVLNNVIRFGPLCVRDVMTPRTVVVAFPEETTVAEVVAEVIAGTSAHRFSRIPIYTGDVDTVTGYVLMNDVLLSAAQGRTEQSVAELRREIRVVPDTQPLRDLFAQFLDRRDNIAVLVDQYGGMAGIVTMEDIVETLLGMEIVDESDTAIDMQKEARRQWRRRARQMGIVDADDPLAEDPATDDSPAGGG